MGEKLTRRLFCVFQSAGCAGERRRRWLAACLSSVRSLAPSRRRRKRADNALSSALPPPRSLAHYRPQLDGKCTRCMRVCCVRLSRSHSLCVHPSPLGDDDSMCVLLFFTNSGEFRTFLVFMLLDVRLCELDRKRLRWSWHGQLAPSPIKVDNLQEWVLAKNRCEKLTFLCCCGILQKCMPTMSWGRNFLLTAFYGVLIVLCVTQTQVGSINNCITTPYTTKHAEIKKNLVFKRVIYSWFSIQMNFVHIHCFNFN